MFHSKVIGKNGKLILRSDEVPVEICDHTNIVLEDIQVHELNPLETMVTYDLDVNLGTGMGNISGSGTLTQLPPSEDGGLLWSKDHFLRLKVACRLKPVSFATKVA